MKRRRSRLPDDNGTGRDSAGLFVAGNQVARAKRSPYKAALKAAVTLDDLRAVFANVLEQARAGDLRATHLLLGYCLGKPRTMDASALKIELPDLNNLAGCADAVTAVVQGAANGELELTQAAALVSMLDAVRAAHEARELETRLGALEERLR